MLTTFLWSVAFIGGLLSVAQMILDGIGTFQTAKDVFQHRGSAIRLLGKILTSRWLSPTLCIFSFAALYAIEFGIPSTIWDRDLRVSIPRYTFNQDTGKLVSEVYFVNHGDTRRTVLAVHFSVRAKGTSGDQRQMLIDNPKELYGGGKSFYIAPNEPITQSFEQTIDPALLRVAGNIFGFHFYTFDGDGRPNYTDIDVLEIIDAKALGMAQLTKRVENVSLDKRWDAKAGNKWKKWSLIALLAIIVAAVVWQLVRQRPTAVTKARLYKLSNHLDEQIEDGARRIEQVEQRRKEQEPVFDLNNAFEIDAFAVSDLQNRTEQGQDLRGTPGWCMDCVVSIHNRHPTQGLGDVTFRIIDITPPMKAAPSHHPRTQDATLRRVKFGFTDLPAPNALAGDQTGHIKIFQASKQIMLSEAIKEPPGKSRFTILHFDGVWPEGVKTIFAPEGEYLLTMEVAGSGVRRKEEHFALSFPMEIKQSVFWIRKVDPTCEQAKKCFRETAALLNSINLTSFHAFWKCGAGQLPSSESIAEACRLLVANSHEDPFAGLEEYIPARDYYAFFDFLKHDASNGRMNFGEGNAYLEAAERWHDKQQYSKPSSDARLRMTFRKVGTC